MHCARPQGKKSLLHWKDWLACNWMTFYLWNIEPCLHRNLESRNSLVSHIAFKSVTYSAAQFVPTWMTRWKVKESSASVGNSILTLDDIVGLNDLSTDLALTRTCSCEIPRTLLWMSILLLPTEILLAILFYLDVADILNARQVRSPLRIRPTESSFLLTSCAKLVDLRLPILHNAVPLIVASSS